MADADRKSALNSFDSREAPWSDDNSSEDNCYGGARKKTNKKHNSKAQKTLSKTAPATCVVDAKRPAGVKPNGRKRDKIEWDEGTGRPCAGTDEPAAEATIDRRTGRKFLVVHVYDATEAKTLLHDLTVISLENIGKASATDASKKLLGNVANKDDGEDLSPRVQLLSLKVPTAMTCSSCSASFGSQEEQRNHFKQDWHRFNLKQRIKGEASVTEEAFNLSADRVHSGSGKEVEEDVHSKALSTKRRPCPSALPPYLASGSTSAQRRRSPSLSSTDTEDDESSQDEDYEVKRNPKVFFQNKEGQFLSMYRCILHGKQNVPAHDGELIRAACNVLEKLVWAVIMIGGGHFAAGIFQGKDVLMHKTFHRYTVRAKQGTSQGSKDGKQGGSQPRSAGASLRRHNEVTLVQDVQSLLISWSDTIKKCNSIFYRAPGPNKATLFGGKNPPLRKGDVRLRHIPFATGKSTFQEVQRIQEVLSTIECHEEEADLIATLAPIPPPTRKLAKSKHKSEKVATDGGINEEVTLRKSLLKQGPPLLDDSSSLTGGSDSEVMELVAEDMILDMSELKIFHNTRKPKRRWRKYSREKGRSDSFDMDLEVATTSIAH